MSTLELLILLMLLSFKHYLCDYIFQTNNHVKYKGIYGHKIGIEHSIHHAIGTYAILFVMFPALLLKGFLIAVIEGIVHYHIDFVKMKYFSMFKPTDTLFWMVHGSDQYLHYLTYFVIAFILIL